jgi:hypothetical protein
MTPQLFGNRRGAEAKIALKLRRSAICTVLDEVGTDFRELGVGFLVTFKVTSLVRCLHRPLADGRHSVGELAHKCARLPTKKVTESFFIVNMRGGMARGG